MDFINSTISTPENSSFDNVTETSVTTRESFVDPVVKKVMSGLLLAIMIVVMVSLGCTISINDLRKQLRRPVEIITGMVCQFIIYPPSVFGLAHALQLPKWDALGMILLGTCPGGHISNIMTYWSDGNVALSVSMTAVSTAIGIGMMPLNLWIYSRSWTDESAIIPYKNILISLVCLVTPVPVGIFILKKWPKVAVWISRIGSTLGFLMICVFLVMSLFEYPEMFTSSWKLWFAAFFLPVQGLILGYIVTSILRRPHSIRRTVAIEVSSQNVAICLTIITVTFPMETRINIMMFPLLFAVSTTVCLSAFVILYRTYVVLKRHCTGKNNSEIDIGTSDDFLKKPIENGQKGEK